MASSSLYRIDKPRTTDFPNLDKMLEMEFGAFEQVKKQLQMIQCTFATSQIATLWHSPYCHALDDLRHCVRLLETEHDKPFEWQSLEYWLAHVLQSLHQMARRLRATCVATEQDMVDPARVSEENQVIVEDHFQQHLMTRRLEHEFGPEWKSRHQEIFEVVDSLSNDSAIPLSLARKNFQTLSDQILQHWAKLRDSQQAGLLDLFRRFWSGQSLEWRRQWLQKNFPYLHDRPHAAIYDFMGSPTDTYKSDTPQVLRSPLLNIPALSQDDYLADFLDIRARVHPKLFLCKDSEFVSLGIWSEKLPRKSIGGKISFSLDLPRSNTEYGFRLEDDVVKFAHLSSPRNALLQLQAQELTYDFLVSCIQTAEDHTHSMAEADLPHNDNHLLSHSPRAFGPSLRLSLVKSNSIDWNFVKGLLQGLFDEALDDLRQIRTDAAYWLYRFQGVRKSGSGRTLNLLGSICHRISVFGELCTSLAALEEKSWCGTQETESVSSQPVQTVESLKEVMNFRVALRCILNEALASLRASRWTPRSTYDTVLTRLLKLMINDEPVLRIMGLHAVMEVIDLEIESPDHGQTIPFDILQLLHVMSAVSACEEEVDKHCLFLLAPGMEYLQVLDKAEDKWTQRHDPWKSLLKHMEQRTRSKRYQLDALASRMTPMEHRHQLFWITVDTSWTNKKGRPQIFEQIMSDTPVSISQPTLNVPAVNQWPQLAEEHPTYTQLRKSRRRPAKPTDDDAIPDDATVTVKPVKPPTRICVQKEDQQFWHDLLHKTQGSSHFADFCAMLQRCGYTMYAKTGAARRFELKRHGSCVHSIIFHEPHPNAKLSNHEARGEWSSRILRHVDVDMA